MYIRVCVVLTAYDDFRLAPQVLNLELCLPCTQFFFFLSRDLISSIIIYSSWSYPVARMISHVEIVTSSFFSCFLFFFLFSFSLPYLLRSYNYIRKYTYLLYESRLILLWELFLITYHLCVCVTWLSILSLQYLNTGARWTPNFCYFFSFHADPSRSAFLSPDYIPLLDV